MEESECETIFSVSEELKKYSIVLFSRHNKCLEDNDESQCVKYKEQQENLDKIRLDLNYIEDNECADFQ